MPNITLTPEQLNQIKEEMNQKVELLSDEEVQRLAQQINANINLPFLNEEKEFIVFVKVVKWIDRQLYHLLPNEVYALVQTASDGLSKEEAKMIQSRLTPLINNVVNIPILTEKTEAKLIDTILSLITGALEKGSKI